MLELRERTLLRNEFNSRLGTTITYQDIPPSHWIANIEEDWLIMIDYWNLIRKINKFENQGYRCTYSEFFDLQTARPRLETTGLALV